MHDKLFVSIDWCCAVSASVMGSLHTETVLIFWFCSKERSIHFWMNLSIRTLINQVSPQRVSVVRMPTDSTVFCLFTSYLILWKLAVVLHYQITRNIKKNLSSAYSPRQKKRPVYFSLLISRMSITLWLRDACLAYIILQSILSTHCDLLKSSLSHHRFGDWEVLP